MSNILNRPPPPRKEEPAPASTHPALGRLLYRARQLGIELPDKAPDPVDVSGLGTAIQQLIDASVAERIAKELERQREQSSHTERMMREFNAPAPLPPTPANAGAGPRLVPEMQFVRDSAGQIFQVKYNNGAVLQAVRDGAGKVIGMKEIRPPTVPPPTPDAGPNPYQLGIPQ
ncbi:hypothetical protein NVV94_12120 [Pseudomonas sp. LS1212]|uniref:hypothetical protein n=1 Tax=Pseudomonas sp. LS1212 TaxID=2972478 RepID=UPI00215C7BE3|nr:hypothetical protein [Pseudomonas sp. LS1212]UVJ46210.1 hypothetical protein NVV94_12120 [Pseudomonas sp. LS1212]